VSCIWRRYDLGTNINIWVQPVACFLLIRSETLKSSALFLYPSCRQHERLDYSSFNALSQTFICSILIMLWLKMFQITKAVSSWNTNMQCVFINTWAPTIFTNLWWETLLYKRSDFDCLTFENGEIKTAIYIYYSCQVKYNYPIFLKYSIFYFTV